MHGRGFGTHISREELEEHMIKGFRILFCVECSGFGRRRHYRAAFNGIVGSLVKTSLLSHRGHCRKPDFRRRLQDQWQSNLHWELPQCRISFLIIASVVYFGVVLPINKLLERSRSRAPAPRHENLPSAQRNTLAAKRCAHCAQPVA